MVTEKKNDTPVEIDQIGRKILIEMQRDCRISFTELGRRVGLSTSAVMERVHRLEDQGVIQGYSALIDVTRVGYPILAFIAINVTGEILPRLGRITKTMPEVLECHRITGANSFILKVIAASVHDLERLIDRLTPYVNTTTSLVLSSVIEKRVIEPHSNV